MDTTNVYMALALTLFAGLSTGIGSLLAFFTRQTNTRLLTFSLGLSAGVMIYVSFVELLSEGREALSQIYGNQMGSLYAVISFFGGIAFIAVIDNFVPSFENPHEARTVEEFPATDENGLADENTTNGKKDSCKNSSGKSVMDRKLMKMGVLTALVISIHNFPEGIATFVAALNDVSLGLPIAIAVAIHNIPEGIAVAVPIYFATKCRKKAFWLSFSSGLAEPLGAVIAYLVLMPFLNETVLGVIFGVIAGIMVFISIDELLPTSEKYGEHHYSIYGFVLGMAIMAASLLIL